MKTHKYVMSMLLVILLIVPFNMLAQEQEIPITTSSKEALKLFLEGRVEADNFNFAAANRLFEEAIQKDPEFAFAYSYRSFFAKLSGQSKVAQENIEKAVNLINKVSEGEKHFILYCQGYVEENNSKQKEHLDQLVILYPSDKIVRLFIGFYYFSLNDYSNSIEHFTKAIEIDEKWGPPYNLLGYAHSRLDNNEEAEKAFKTYIKLQPNSANPYDSYGDLLFKTRKYDEAIENFKKAFMKNSDFTYSLRKAGNIYCLKGDYKTARINYKRVYDVATTSKVKMRALYWQAVTYIYENNMTEALKLYKEYQSIAEQEKQLSNYRIWAYANFGNIHTELGDPAEGMKYYKKAIDLIDKVELQKSEKETITFNSIQWQATALIAQGELDKAKEILKKYEQKVAAKEDEAKEKTLNIIRARLAMAEGNDDAALELLSKADASNPMIVYYQAVIYEKKGDKEKASELYKKIKEWTENSIWLAFVRNKMSKK